MRFSVIPVALFILVSCNNAEQKPAGQKIASQHTAGFNSSFDAMMSDYYALSEGFVNWDSNAVNARAAALQKSLNSLALDDLKKDSAAYLTAKEAVKNTLASVEEIGKAADMTAKRRSFNALSQNIYDLLRAVKYDEKKLYLQECPMAFNDVEPGLWLTDKGADAIRNPYLGLKHPKYGDAMLECGSNKAIVDFIKEEKQQQEKKQVDEKTDSSRTKSEDKN
jgi:hypothetical protein